MVFFAFPLGRSDGIKFAEYGEKLFQNFQSGTGFGPFLFMGQGVILMPGKQVDE